MSAPKKARRRSHGDAPQKGLEHLLQEYIQEYLANNRAAFSLAQGLKVLGIGLWPLIDHFTFYTLDANKRVQEFLPYGYRRILNPKLILGNWRIRIYYKKGYPLLCFEELQRSTRGVGHAFSEWVKNFSDKPLHHLAVRVEDIEQAVYFMEKQGIAFSGRIIGQKGAPLRQVFTRPERKEGRPFTVLELVERHEGFEGLVGDQVLALTREALEESFLPRKH